MTESKVLRYEGRTAVVTGVGTDLGQAYARYLAGRGARVLVNDPDYVRSAAAADEITASGGTAVAAPGAVDGPEMAEAILALAVERFGSVDIVINGAGGAVDGADASEPDAEGVIRATLLATVWMDDIALRRMRAQGYGRIVNTASTGGAFGRVGAAAQAAASAGVIGLTRSIALDAAGTGIAVNAVLPVADTAQSRTFFDHNPWLTRECYTVDVVAPTVGYLCHDSCQLNGHVLTVAAGRVAKVFTSTTIGALCATTDAEEVASNLRWILDQQHAVTPRSDMDDFLLIDV